MILDKVVNLKANYIVTKCNENAIACFVARFLWLSGYWLSIIDCQLKAEGENMYKQARLEATKDDTFRKKYLSKLQFETHNLVPDLLRFSLATLISGSTVSPSFKANIVALGADATLPTNADIKLWTETIRSTFTNRYAIDNIAYLDKFFASVDVSGNTYLECGVFVDWDPWIADSGYLLSRINMDETISVNETLTINATITIV